MVSTPQEERKSNGCGFQPEVNLSNFPSNSRKPLNQVFFGVTCNMATPNEHEKIFKTLIISASPLCRCFKSGFKLFFNHHHHHHHRTCNSFLVKAFDILPTGKPTRTLTSIYPPIQKKCIFWGMLHHRVPYKFPHSKVHWNSPPAQRTRRCAPHNGVLMGLLLIPGHGSFEKERGKPRRILFTGILWACPILSMHIADIHVECIHMFIDDASAEPE